MTTNTQTKFKKNPFKILIQFDKIPTNYKTRIMISKIKILIIKTTIIIFKIIIVVIMKMENRSNLMNLMITYIKNWT